MLEDRPEAVAARLSLSSTERAIFLELFARRNELVARAELLEVVRAKAPHTIDSHIMAIRRKLVQHGAGMILETVRNSGFILHT